MPSTFKIISPYFIVFINYEITLFIYLFTYLIFSLIRMEVSCLFFVEVTLGCSSKNHLLPFFFAKRTFSLKFYLFIYLRAAMCSVPGDKPREPCFPLLDTCFLRLLHNWTQFWPMEHKGKSARVFLGMVFLSDQKRSNLCAKALLFYSSPLLIAFGNMFCEGIMTGANLRPWGS